MKIFVGWAFLPTNDNSRQVIFVVGKNAHPTGGVE